jgi:hypothetical protein
VGIKNGTFSKEKSKNQFFVAIVPGHTRARLCGKFGEME